MPTTSIHLAHDWLVGLRGGEWVLDRLAQLFGPTTLYTLVNDEKPLTPSIDACDVVTSPLQGLPGASGKLRRWYFPLMPWAVDAIRVRPCDLLISTSSAVMKSIKPPPGVPHLCYCHSPARYAWDQTKDYAHGSGGSVRSLGLRLTRKQFQEWDRKTASRVTTFLANSKHTAEKIEQFLGCESSVVYPPVRTNYYTVDTAVEREDFYLVVSALEPYKRVDLVIEAANTQGIPLKVVGKGSQYDQLCKMAGEGVTMLGRVDDETLRNLYRRARGLIHPQIEDFGIIAVEAQACGCPVIAYAKGGAMETVPEHCGFHFDEQSSQAMINAIKTFKQMDIDSKACRQNAERFSESVFDDAIRHHVSKLLASKPQQK